MRIGVVTMWYNELVLGLLFLKHYAFAADVRVILDADMPPAMLADHEYLVSLYPNVTSTRYKFPEMMDAELKHQRLQQEFDSMLACDWVLVVDADEFVFALPFEPMCDFLACQGGNVVYAHMWQVYRHVTDKDIDLTMPAILQRQHGDPDMTTWYNSHYIKPCVAKPSAHVKFGVGCHTVGGDDITPSAGNLYGTHWKMADPALAIERRITNGRLRQSPQNIARNHQCHDFNITEAQILAECAAHANDPLLYTIGAA